MVFLIDISLGTAGPKEKAPKNQHSKIRSFPFHLLRQATNHFDEARVVGHGGFGKVYMGELEGKKFAVKRKSLDSSQGQKEFQAEIAQLSGLNHSNLVSLIGYCDENNELILVYEYMEKGALSSHLYGSDKPSLNWKQRLEVSIGAAKGLHYLHTNSAKTIIHRDVKSLNILLDEKLRAKVTDFGISKPGPELNKTHVITQVKGSFGYLDPEYCKTLRLTDKSDVYSFGVVLLEVLCGRPVFDRTLEVVNLVEWGKEMLKKEQLEQIVDQKISGTVKKRSLIPFGKIVARCLQDKGADRPSMEDVLRTLEYVLSLEAKKNALTRSVAMISVKTSNVADGFSDPSTHRVSPVLDDSIISVAGNSDDPVHDISAGNSDEHDHNVSSQLIKPGNRKALTRLDAKIFERDEEPDVSSLGMVTP